jgi:MFS family permease
VNLRVFSRRPHGVWAERDFRTLWLSLVISQSGSLITELALPFAAVVALHATPGEIGIMYALESIPRVALVLVGGVWADRIRRKPLLVWGDVAAAGLIGSIPVAAALGVLSIGQLYVVAFLSGLLSAFLAPAWSSFYPTAVPKERLADANQVFHATGGVLNAAVPPVAGVLIQVFTAPFVMAFDAISLLASAVLVRRLSAADPPGRSGDRRRLRTDLAVGFRFLWENRVLRAITISSGIWGFAGFGIVTTLSVLYLRRLLGLSAALIGALTAFGGLSLVAATYLAPRLRARIGVGRTVLLAVIVLSAQPAILALARRGSSAEWPLLFGFAVCAWGGFFLANVHFLTIRQLLTPERMLGRVSAISQLAMAVSTAAGALVAGALGEAVGLRPTLWVAAGILPFSVLVVAASPLRRMRELPAASAEPAAARFEDETIRPDRSGLV